MRKEIVMMVFILLSGFYSDAQLSITTDSLIQTGTCAGSSIIVRYKTAGGNFNPGNRFTAQLSNAFGQFTAPVNIGSSIFNSGFILATLPKTAQFGFLYRVRVISTSPAVTGSSSPNTVIITSTSLTATIFTPNGTTMCPGDSLTIQAFLPNASYQWSTGATTQSIKVKNTGSYWVKVTDPLGCDARDTVEITSKPDCVLNTDLLSIFPNPTSVNNTITLRGVPLGFDVHFYDMIGRKIFMVPISNNSRVQLPATLSSGVYYIVIRKNEERIKVGKLVVVQ
jgi:hypothetical protein